ncbi:MAG: PAS domain-containing protein, partial [Acetobacteraceae bacterium]|nr:PAS domain-containing protein [Acetobacteraceae bacterium]
MTTAVFESTPDAIAIVGKDYRYRRVNPVYERRWGIRAERIVGMHVSEVLGADVFEHTVQQNLDRCFAGEEITYAAWFATALGRLYLVVTYSPLRQEAGQGEAALMVSR